MESRPCATSGNAKDPGSERGAVATAPAVLEIPEGIKISSADGVMSRCGQLALNLMLDGVSGIVQRCILGALEVQVLREPMIEPATKGSGKVRRVLVDGGTRRWEGPVRGQDL